MIYTSYFGALKELPANMVPVAICLIPPEDWNGSVCRELAPTEEILIRWKKDHDEEAYRKAFRKEVLDRLNFQRLIPELLRKESRKIYGELVLLCYEKPGEFCHRHLVAEWLIEQGFECKEWCPGDSADGRKVEKKEEDIPHWRGIKYCKAIDTIQAVSAAMKTSFLFQFQTLFDIACRIGFMPEDKECFKLLLQANGFVYHRKIKKELSVFMETQNFGEEEVVILNVERPFYQYHVIAPWVDAMGGLSEWQYRETIWTRGQVKGFWRKEKETDYELKNLEIPNNKITLEKIPQNEDFLYMKTEILSKIQQGTVYCVHCPRHWI